MMLIEGHLVEGKRIGHMLRQQRELRLLVVWIELIWKLVRHGESSRLLAFLLGSLGLLRSHSLLCYMCGLFFIIESVLLPLLLRIQGVDVSLHHLLLLLVCISLFARLTLATIVLLVL